MSTKWDNPDDPPYWYCETCGRLLGDCRGQCYDDETGRGLDADEARTTTHADASAGHQHNTTPQDQAQTGPDTTS